MVAVSGAKGAQGDKVFTSTFLHWMQAPLGPLAGSRATLGAAQCYHMPDDNYNNNHIHPGSISFVSSPQISFCGDNYYPHCMDENIKPGRREFTQKVRFHLCGAGGEQRRPDTPLPITTGSPERLCPVGCTALNRGQQDRVRWNAPTWGPGGPGDPCTHGDCVVSSSRMRFFMSGERSFSGKQHKCYRSDWGDRRRVSILDADLPPSPVPKTDGPLIPPWVSQAYDLPGHQCVFCHLLLRQTWLQ